MSLQHRGDPPSNPLTPEEPALRQMRAVYFFYFASVGIYAVFLNVHFYNIGLSGLEIGLVNTLIPLMGMLGSPLWGVLADRSGQLRRLLLLAAAGSLAAVMALFPARTLTWILILIGVFAFFQGPLVPLLDTLTLNLLGGRRHLYGRQRIFGTLGYILTALTLGGLIERYGSPALFGGYGLVMLLVLASLRFLPPRQAAMPAGIRLDLGLFVREWRWLAFALSLFFLGIALNGLQAFLAIYIQDLGGGERLIGLAFALTAISETPIMLAGGWLIQRFGSRRLLRLAFLLYAVRLLLYSLAPSAGWVVGFGLMHGLTFGLYWISSVAYTDELAAGQMTATAHNLRAAVLYLANLLGSLLGGWLYDMSGGRVMFQVMAALALLAFFLSGLIGRSRERG